MNNLGCSYYDNKNPIHFKTDMEYLKKNNINHIILCFSENDKKYYADTFKELVAICKNLNIEVWLDPWGFGGIYGGEAFSWYGAWKDNCKQVAVNANGIQKDVSVLCFNNPNTIALMQNWVDAAANTNCDSIFWDEPHFFEPSHFGYPANFKGCFCKHCQALYKQLFNAELNYNSKNIAVFKAKSIQLFLTKMMAYTKQKKLKNVVCLLPDYNNLNLFYEDIKAYFENDLTDVVATDPYPNLFGKKSEDAKQIAFKMFELSKKYNKPINYWIQGFRLKQEDYKNWLEELTFCKNQKIDYLSIWSFRACKSMSALACFDSNKIWNDFMK